MFDYLLLLLGPVIDPFLQGDIWPLILRFVPFVVFYELPYSLLIYTGMWKYLYGRTLQPYTPDYRPDVSVIIICYNEGALVQGTIRTIAEQLYPGRIEMFAMIDGAADNEETYRAAQDMSEYVLGLKNRSLMVVPKWQRGGRVSNINTALNYLSGDIVMVLDGDTSFDNNMVAMAVRHFIDPSVVAVSGCLRVRNADESLVASLQAVEYFISIQTAKTGLSEFNIVNNVSGAFGVFRHATVDLVKGWDAGTAEDLDMTIRIKQYFGRYGKKFRIVFDPEAIGFTDVPATLEGFFKQRQRWDGDLSFIYFKKHAKAFRPALVGWPNFLMLVINGLYSQIVLPGILFIYTIWLVFRYPLYYVLSLLLAVYIFYYLVLLVMYVTSVIFISERKKEDLKRLPLLLIFPLFTFSARINSFLATVLEICFKSHKDSSMAPWWVTKKSKFD